MKYTLFLLAFFVMCFAYTYGTFHPETRDIAGPVSLVAAAVLICCMVALLRPSSMKRALKKARKQHEWDLQQLEATRRSRR